MKVPLLDLRPQLEELRDEIVEAVTQVIDSTRYIMGPEIDSLEKEISAYCGTNDAVGVSSGTDALLLALMVLDVGPGDLVLTSNFSFFATAGVVARLNATPVFVDIDEQTFNIDPESLRRALAAMDAQTRKRVKAIIPVHLYGQCADMEAIIKISREYNIPVIEDAAQAIGAECEIDGQKRSAGSSGDFGCFSFFPSKNLGCYGDGGAIFTNDDDLAHVIRGIVNHGMYKRYHHDVVGVNSRLDSIQAAVLRAKLPKLDQYNTTRRNTARKYTMAFAGIQNIITPTGFCDSSSSICDTCDCHVFHQYTLQVKNIDRDALVAHLNANDIPCGVYYPIPLHLQKAYADTRYKEADFTVTNRLVKEVVSLPMHTELDDEQIAFITKTLIDFVTK